MEIDNMLLNWLADWKRTGRIVGNRSRKSRRRGGQLRPVPQHVESLEDRTLLSTVTYMPGIAPSLDFDADAGDVDNVTISANASNGELIIMVGVGDTITLELNGGDANDFMLSNGGRTLTINSSNPDNVTPMNGTSPIDTFTINLGDQGDTLNITNDISGQITNALIINGGMGNDTINAGPAGMAVTINGGAGDDDLTGSGLADEINGDAGNDTIIGGQGNDDLSGGDDDDTFIWNNGDGSDDIEGDDGTDDVEVNLSNALTDTFEISANGARLQFNRTDAGRMFNLDMGTTEDLVVNALGNDDSGEVTEDLSSTDLENLTLNMGTGPGDEVTVTGDPDANTNINDAETVNLDDNITGMVSGNADTVNVTSPGSIQDGIDVAASGATVNVGAGTYDEQLNIPKSLILDGGVAAPVVQPSAAPMPGVFDIEIDAPDVTVQNMIFDFNGVGDAREGMGFVVSDLNGPAATGVTIQNNEIFTGHASTGIQTGKNADVSNLLIQGNTIHGDADGLGEGVYINPSPSTNIQILNNTIDGALFAGVSVQASNVTVSGNQIDHDEIGTFTEGVAAGIRVFDLTTDPDNSDDTFDNILIGGPLVTDGNTINNFARGIDVGSSTMAAMAGSTVNALLQNNTVTDSTIGIRVRDGGTADIENSTAVMNNGTGLQGTNADAISITSGTYAGIDVTDTDSVTTIGDVTSTGDIILETTGDISVQTEDGTTMTNGGLKEMTNVVNVTLSPGGTATFEEGTDSGYSGTTTLTTGTTLVNGALSGGGSVDVEDMATLGGTGTITGPVNVEDGGTISPGTSPGILATGSLDLMAGSTYVVEVEGFATAGDDYDQIAVTGSVDIDNTAMTGAILSLEDDVPGSNNSAFLDVLTIIDNDGNDSSTDGVTGNFAALFINGTQITSGDLADNDNQLEDGDSFTFDGDTWRIFYNGGDGNDVVLVRTAAMINTVYVNDNFAQTGGTVITDADPNTDGDQTAVVGVNAFATIQDGIDAADDGGSVLITDDLGTDGPGTYTENITIDKDLTVRGTEGDPDAVLVEDDDGTPAPGVFTIEMDNTVTIDSITIQNGSTDTNGGGINNAGDLTLTNSVVQNNVAMVNGGGIYNASTGTLTLDITEVSGNTANGNAATEGGGGIYNDGGSVTLRNATDIDSNDANGAAGSGGGIFNNAGTVDIVGTVDGTSGGALSVVVIQNNQANRAGGGIETLDGTVNATLVEISGNTIGTAMPGNGGGLHTSGTDTVTLTRSVVSNNQAVEGGGLWAFGDTELAVTDSSITGNIAAGTGASTGGGGIHVDAGSGNAVLIIDGSTIANNAANDDTNGGGINFENGMATITNSTISTNSADGDGGGLFVVDGTVNLDSVTVFVNTSTDAGGEQVFVSGGSVTATNSILADQTAGAAEDDALEGTIAGNNNLTSDGDNGNFTGGSNIFMTDPDLGSLSDNGGPITALNGAPDTHLPNTSSPVIDAGATTLTVDQRNVTRPAGSADDIGAVEVFPEPMGPFAVVYVNDTFDDFLTMGDFIQDADPNMAGDQNAVFGINAFATIQEGVDNVGIGGTVLITDDIDGPTSSDDAVTSNDGPGTYTETVTVNTDNIIIRSSEMDAAAVLVEGVTDSGFVILSGNTVTIDSVTIQNGNAVNGGGINNDGDLTVLNSVITENNATSDGGGIYNTGTLTVDNTTITENVANDDGGGIYSDGDLTLENNVFLSDNDAEDGGGLYLGSNASATISITDTTIDGNTSSDDGGGIYNNSGATFTLGSTVSITDNTADGASNDGGGIYNNSGDLTIDGTVISGNSADDGGGIYNNSTLTVQNTTIEMNDATQNGGGIYNNGTLTVDNSAFQLNGATNGGGIYNDTNGDTVSITGGTLIQMNMATNQGGGLWNNGGAGTTIDPNDPTLDTITIQNNTADVGGGIYNTQDLNLINVNVQNNNATTDGGGIFNDDDMLIVDSTIQNNTADQNGGGIFNNEGGPETILTVDNTTISGNIAHGTATGDGGGGIYNNTGAELELINGTMITGNAADGNTDPLVVGQAGSGGGILNNGGMVDIVGTVDGDVDSALNAVVISNNTANRAGGGIETNNGTVNITFAIISSNDVTAGIANPGFGGGVHITGAGTVELDRSVVSGNTAVEGGGLWVSGTGTLDILDSSVTDNLATGTAGTGGGGIHVDAGTGDLTIDGSTIADNTANGGTNGGGINFEDGTAQITNSTITTNVATGDGGGLFVDAGTVDLDSLTVYLNTDGNGLGEQIFISSGAVQTVNSIIADDTTGGGDAIEGLFASGSTFNLTSDADNGNFNVLDMNNIFATDPDLAPLDNYGGPTTADGTPTDTYLPNPGSPVIDAGSTTLDMDQRNVPRPDGPQDDIGAVETLSVNLDDIYVNDDFTGPVGTIIQDADPNTAGDQTAVFGLNAFATIQAGVDAVNDGGRVNITDDINGPNASPDAISANDGPGTYMENVTVNKSVSILSTEDDAAAVIVDGNATGSVFAIGTGFVVTLNALTIQNGDAGASDGGGVLNAGDLTIQDSIIQNNTATNGGGIANTGTLSLDLVADLSDNTAVNGGGIFNSGDLEFATPTIITGNTADNGGGIYHDGGTITDTAFVSVTGNSANLSGGGIYNTATLTLDNTTIDSNTASGDLSTQGGGGIYNDGGTLNLSGTADVTNNTADGDAGSGGGIFNNGGTLDLTGIDITGNTANRAGGGIEDVAGMATLNSVTLDNNTAQGIVGVSPGNGGGLHITGASNVEITGGTVNDNFAEEEGGGLWNSGSGTLLVTGTTIDGNTANGDGIQQGGGGVFNDGGDVTIDSAIITNNVATATSAGSGGGGIFNNGEMTLMDTVVRDNLANNGSADGGGILNSSAGELVVIGGQIAENTSARAGGGIEIASGGNVDLLNATIRNNVTGINGGGVHISGIGSVNVSNGFVQDNTAGEEGGGLWNSATGTLTIDGTTILRNTANALDSDSLGEQGGGGVFNNGGLVGITDATITQNVSLGNNLGEGGGGILNRGQMTISNTSITTNQANMNDGNGGAILNTSSGTLTINSGTLISGNTAARAGGGIENDGGSVSITNSNVLSNTTGVNGGGIHISGSGTVTITGGQVQNNTAGEEGGGLWNSADGTMTVTGTNIQSNTANGDGADQGGGGVFNAGGEVILGNVTIENNVSTATQAGNGGAGIFNDGGLVTVTDTTITGNQATNGTADGGGILTNGGTVNVSGGLISGNEAARAGGGIENNVGTVTLTTVTVESNSAGVNGGGLHVSGAGTTDVSGGTFENNVADEEGGGLWNGTGTMTIDGTTITGNTANAMDNAGNNQGGGGVFNAGGTLDIDNATITGNRATLNSGNGGGVMTDGGMVTIDDTTISGNEASRAGGGVENNVGTVTLTTVTVESNSAGVNGGGLHVSGAGTTDVSGGTFENNVADEEGGGLWNGTGTMTIDGTTITGNTANAMDNAGNNQGGGGVFNAGGTLDIDNATITGNRATLNSGNGGGVMTDGGMVTIDNTTISGNEAARAGGGVENNVGTVTLTTVTVESNSAGVNGGGLHVSGAGTTDVIGGTFEDNVADEEGGGLWNGTGTMTIDGTTITGNTASGNGADQGGGGVFNAGGTINIQNGVTISSNTADGTSGGGGGILNDAGGTITVEASEVSSNSSTNNGGGVFNADGIVTLDVSTITSNAADNNGGGVFNNGTFTATASTIDTNSSDGDGGGIWNNDELNLTNTTLSGNTAADNGGGVFTSTGTVTIQNTTIANNQGSTGGGIFHDDSGTVTLVSTIVASNTGGDTSGTVGGTSNLIGGDPRLAPLADNGGPTQTHALLPDSPAINAGENPLGLMFDQRGTPFVREFGSGVDPNQTDIGAFELQSVSGGGNDIIVTATGPDVEGSVQVVNAITQEVLYDITPYPGFLGGVRVAVADVNGDMTPDIITAAGPGGGPHVKVFDGTDGTTLLMNFFAYDAAFTGGVYVAAADLNGDNMADIITGADAGGGPHVRAFSGMSGSELSSFFAYDPAFNGGVRVAVGDISGDSTPDIITGAGPGGGPHVRVFDGAGPQVLSSGVGVNISGPLGSFFPYDTGFTGGVFVAAGDVNGDDQIDIVTGAGAGGGPHVRVFDGATGTQMAGDIGSFFAYDSGLPGQPGIFAGGVRVGASDITGDGKADIITVPGQGGGPNLRAFDADSVGPEVIRNITVGDPLFTGGLSVAGSTILASSGSPLLLASGFAPNLDADNLTFAELEPVFEAALARLESAGLPGDVTETLATLTIEVADLSGNQLGESLPGIIRLDINAAGLGWFVDPTPNTDEEFAGAGLNAIDPSVIGRVDLLTVLLHELAHQLGGEDLDAEVHAGHLLAETLPPSQRRLPDPEDLDLVFSDPMSLLGEEL